jgi:hypothetical protein|tara:strand:- start:1542 stop:1724 length:183 start_codon:yes stop_codon:yes gene_type:complete
MPAWIKLLNFASARVRRAVWLLLCVAVLQALSAPEEPRFTTVRGAIPNAAGANVLQPALD